MSINRKRLLLLICSLFISTFSLFLIENIYAGILVSTFVIIFMWYIARIKENMYIVLFLIAFFSFLMGHVMVKEIFHNDLAYYSVPIPQHIENYTYCLLILSLIFICIGYAFPGVRIHRDNLKKQLLSYNSFAVKKVEKATKIMSAISSVCLFVVNAESVVYVQTVGYLASYLGKQSIIPNFIHQLASMASIIFAFYLATIPEKHSARYPIVCYCIAMGICVFAGRRYEVVSVVLLLVLYATYRNRLGKETWITKKQALFLILILPLSVLILTLISSWRAGVDKNIDIHLFLEFMSGVGNSSQIISYENMYHDELSARGVLFSFGNIWRSFFGNEFAQVLGVSEGYASQSVENALYGHSLSAAIMYNVNPQRMLAGGGLGSCYIAELMCDFSYLGVILGNFLIGFVIRRYNELKENNLVGNFMTIFLATALFRIPRDSFDYFFYQLLGIKSLLLFSVIYYVYHRQVKRKIV